MISVPYLHSMSLRGHLLFLVLVALLPMLLLGSALIGGLATEQRKSVEYGLRETAKALALALDREVAANLSALESLAALQMLGQGDLEAFHAQAVLAVHQHPHWANVALMDATGRQILHAARSVGAPLPKVTRFDLARRVMETGRPAVSDLIMGSVSDTPDIAIAVPVMSDGHLRYMLAAVVNPQTWARLLSEFSTEPGTILTAMDGKGRIIARNRDFASHIGQEAPAWYPIPGRRISGDLLRGYALDGTEVIAAFRFSDISGWTLMVARTRVDIDTPLACTLMLTIGAAVLLLVLSLGLAAAMASRIARPMAALAVAGRELAEQRPIVVPPEPGPVAEIERLWRDLADASSKLLHAARTAQHAEARHRSIVDMAMDVMIVLDAEGTIQLFNKAAERTFEYAADEVVGRDIGMLMPEPYRSQHGRHLADYLSTGEGRILGKTREVEGCRKDGSIFPLELSVAEWWTGDQRFFTGIMRDITRRRQAERHLRESHALLEAIIENTPDPIFAKDWSGRYLIANSATAQALGCSRDTIIGKSAHDFLPAEAAARLVTGDREIMALEKVQRLEEEIPHPSHGEPGFYLTTKSPLRDAAGEVIGLVGIARDITERKRAEIGLRQAKEEADRANLAKSKFLAAASHDLRQPAQSLYLLLGALRARLGGHAAAGLLDAMHKALNAQKTLLDGLADISKLDAGRIVPQPTDVALGPLLERLEREYRPRAQEKGLAYRTVATGLSVRSDPALLERMLCNLIENALRYTEQGGVVVGCRRGNPVRIEVADSGLGIPADERETIFDEFHQIGNPERDAAKGLGLGLAVVRRLGRLLGHEVGVTSVPGRGSVFFVTARVAARTGLAASSTQSGAGHAADTADGDGDGLVLVVDDEALVRLGFKAMLEGWGYTVLMAGSADEAIAVLKRHDTCPDLIVADYRLRDNRTGTEAIREIHAHCGMPVPALVVTGDTAPERIIEAESGGFALLHKPVSASDFQRHVRRLVSRVAAG